MNALKYADSVNVVNNVVTDSQFVERMDSVLGTEMLVLFLSLINLSVGDKSKFAGADLKSRSSRSRKNRYHTVLKFLGRIFEKHGIVALLA